MEASIPKNSVLAVTGASGYIASELIHQLFERGYTNVRGTVRNLQDETKVKHLKDLFPKIELYEAELLTEGSFDAICAGADYVFHTASPFQLQVSDPQKDLIDPAVNGTLNVLKSCEKAGTVKRIILTSSMASVASETPIPEGKRLSEDDWNTESTIQTNPYRLSKRLAEEAGWDFIKKHREQGGKMELVTILPSFVLGPPLSQRTDATSIKTVKAALTGGWKESGAPPTAVGVVDVRDVALGHILAMEKSGANGRYLLTTEEAVPHLTWARMLADTEEFKDYPLPDKLQSPHVWIWRGTHQRAVKDLGITFTDPKKSIVDMAHALVKLGIVDKPKSE